MWNVPLPHEVSGAAADLIGVAERAGAAIIVYDDKDRILWANHHQKSLAPVSDYSRAETHASLFWKLFEAGLVGNRVSSSDPAGWLQKAKIARRVGPGLDWSSEYQNRRMVVTHRVFEDGLCVQARIDYQKSGVERYFSPLGCPADMMGLSNINGVIEGFKFALDTINVGVALIGGNGEVLHCNAAFSDIVRSQNILDIDNGKLVPIFENEVYEIDCHVGFALGKENYRSVFCLTNKFGKKEVFAIYSGRSPRTALLLASSACDDGGLAKTLESVLGVNPAEASVAALVGVGLSPCEIAKYRSTAEGTVYTQIKKIKEKIKSTSFGAHDLTGLASLVNRIASVARIKK